MDGPNRVGIELEDIAEAMSQLANIGSELLRPEDDRDPLWRSIPVAKEIMVTKGIASRAPWEAIQVFYLLDAVGLSGISKGKQKLGVTFNFDKQDVIDFTKFS